MWDRVDPGNAGVLIDYCSGTSETITDARYVFVDPRCKRLAEYPTAEYTLEMTGAGTQNDQSVPCVMQDQQTIRMDTATAWSVDPQRVGGLYRMRPGVPLYGSSGGRDVSTLVVRSEVRAGVRDACTKFGWEDATVRGAPSTSWRPSGRCRRAASRSGSRSARSRSAAWTPHRSSTRSSRPA